MACEIVAELSNAHNGKLYRMPLLMDAAMAAGATTLKVQAYTVAELVALRGNGLAPAPWNYMTMEELYTKAQTPLSWLSAIFDYAKAKGYPIFSSVFGAESLAALEAVGCPRYKISHFECSNDALYALVIGTKKPVIVSAARGVSSYWGTEHVVCNGGYPAEPSEMHLAEFSPPWFGVSSHCRHPLVAPLAVARGAQYLEYHFHLESEPSELEANVSLNEREFRAMVQSVRDAEVLLG